jgi:hypothetical protein
LAHGGDVHDIVVVGRLARDLLLLLVDADRGVD